MTDVAYQYEDDEPDEPSKRRGGPGRPRKYDSPDQYFKSTYSNAVQRLKLWHENLVDFYLQYPQARQQDACEYFGVSSVWIGRIENSDAFKEYQSKRLAEHRQLVSEYIISQTQRVAQKGLQKIEERIDADDALKIPLPQLLDATGLALKSLGFGQGGGVNVSLTQNNIGVSPANVTAEMMKNARKKLQLVATRNTQLTADGLGLEQIEVADEAEVVEVVDATPLPVEDTAEAGDEVLELLSSEDEARVAWHDESIKALMEFNCDEVKEEPGAT